MVIYAVCYITLGRTMSLQQSVQQQNQSEFERLLVHCVIENAPHLWSDAAHGEDESDADRERATAVGGA